MEGKSKANDSDSDDMTSDSVYEVARTNEQLKEYRYVPNTLERQIKLATFAFGCTHCQSSFS